MLNKQFGKCIVPIGRDSLMNGVGVAGSATNPSKIADFVVKFRGLIAAQDHLSKWARRIVAENLDELHFRDRNCIALPEYLEAISNSKLDKAKAFDKMCRFFAGN